MIWKLSTSYLPQVNTFTIKFKVGPFFLFKFAKWLLNFSLSEENPFIAVPLAVLDELNKLKQQTLSKLRDLKDDFKSSAHANRTEKIRRNEQWRKSNRKLHNICVANHWIEKKQQSKVNNLIFESATEQFNHSVSPLVNITDADSQILNFAYHLRMKEGTDAHVMILTNDVNFRSRANAGNGMKITPAFKPADIKQKLKELHANI